MSIRHRINEEELAEIVKLRQKNRDKTVDKWLAVLQMYAEGKGRKEVAEKTGFCKAYISELVKEYRQVGLEQFAQKQYRGNRRNMSVEEEEKLLEAFKEQAAAGQMVEIGEIKAAYEEKIGRSLDSSRGQIYRVLHRHDWRKIMPRSRHPNKASDEAIEASKKLTIASRS